MRPYFSTRGGMYSLLEDMDIKAKVSNLARRLEELEMRKLHEVQAVTKTPLPNKPVVSPLSIWEKNVQLFQQ